MVRHLLALAACLTVSAGTLQSQAAVRTPVTIELGLLVDVSGSVDANEFALQRLGYLNVFNDGVFWNAFGASGRTLAVTYAYWASSSQQVQVGGGTGGWYFVNNAATAATFASALGSLNRTFTGSTAPGSAINWLVPQFASNAFLGTRQIIDVSGDGCENDGASTSAARNAAQNLGITINGLPIGNEGCGLSLASWYSANIVTADGFLEPAASFNDFNDAVRQKIGREVTTTVPEPSTVVLLTAGMLGVAVVARKRRVS